MCDNKSGIKMTNLIERDFLIGLAQNIVLPMTSLKNILSRQNWCMKVTFMVGISSFPICHTTIWIHF